MNIQQIVERARARTGAKSDRALAREFGMVHQGLLRITKGHGLPSDAAMVRISRAAGIPIEEGLLLLNMWRSDGEEHTAYTRILKLISTRTANKKAA